MSVQPIICVCRHTFCHKTYSLNNYDYERTSFLPVSGGSGYIAKPSKKKHWKKHDYLLYVYDILGNML